jgi:hypothetical protein
MIEKNIVFILIQIDEAHSSDWPAGLLDEVDSQKNIEERLERANSFVFANGLEAIKIPFPVYVDTWENTFANTYRAWPDKFYCFDSNLKVVYKSEYKKDGKIVKDCTEIICQMIL